MTDEKDKEVETLDTRDFDAEIEEIIDLIEEKKIQSSAKYTP